MGIRNRRALVNNTNETLDRRSRALALGSLDAALASVDPLVLCASQIRRRGNVVSINGDRYNLSRFERVFVIGGGKAAWGMADFVEGLLGDKITEGIVSVPSGSRESCSEGRIDRVVTGGRGASLGLPNAEGRKASARMLRLSELSTEHDLVIALISGGGSALVPYPVQGVSLTDERDLISRMLDAGATAFQTTTVLKHISRIKGGRLAQAFLPSTVIGLIISDDRPGEFELTASGPTVVDHTTAKDAVDVLQQLGVWRDVAASIRRAIERSEREPRTRFDSMRVSNYGIGDVSDACKSATRFLTRNKARGFHLTSRLSGEARVVGTVIGGLAKDIRVGTSTLDPPHSLILGGETTTTVVGNGRGGPCQELALGVVPEIRGLNGCCVAALATDGFDGRSISAGAVVDGKTAIRVDRQGLRIAECLQRNASNDLLTALGDDIKTGVTGTNVGDLVVCVVL